MKSISSRSMKYIGLFWPHFRATCAIPVETWQRPSGFCLQLSFFLSGMSLANSRFQIWFSFNAIDTYVSCFINLICNGNISNHSSPHSVFGWGVISRYPEPRKVKRYLLWDKSSVPCEYVSAIQDLADKEEQSLLQQSLAQLCVCLALLSPKPASASTISRAITCSALCEQLIAQTGSD